MFAEAGYLLIDLEIHGGESQQMTVLQQAPTPLGDPEVPRPRLNALLDAAAPFTLLRAPRGFGKSTLIDQWAPRSRSCLVRLHPPIDRGRLRDVLAEQLAEGDAGVLAERFSDSGAAAAPPPMTPGPHLPRTVAVLIDGLDELTRRLSGEITDLLQRADRVRVIVCARHGDPGAVRGAAVIPDVLISGRDLALTVPEVTALLDSAGLVATDGLAHTLRRQTGGWPALVHAAIGEMAGAAGLRRVDASDVDRVLSELTPLHVDRTLGPLLRRRGPAQLAAAVACAGAVTADQAAFITDDPHADDHLTTLESNGLLTADAEAGGPVYRWPPAVQTALENSARPSARERVIHERLALWHRGHNQPDEALRHAARARAWPVVVHVLGQHWERFIDGARRPELELALAGTPLTAFDSNVRALAVRDVALTRSHRDPGTALLKAIRRSIRRGDPDRLSASSHALEAIGASCAAMIALRERGEHDHALAWAEVTERMLSVARAARPRDIAQAAPRMFRHVGVTRLLVGDLEQSAVTLQVAYELASDEADTPTAHGAAGELTLLHAIQGDLKAADRWGLRADPSGDHHSGRGIAAVRAVDVGAALAAVDRLDRSAAQCALDRAPSPGDLAPGQSMWEPFLACAQARFHLVWGDPREGRRDLGQTQARLGPRTTARVLLEVAELDLLLAAGEVRRARRHLGAVAIRGPMPTVEARIALLTGDPDAAAQTAGTALARPGLTNHDELELLVVLAIALRRLGDTANAARRLQDAIRSARTTGSRFAFATVPRMELLDLAPPTDPMTAILRELPLSSVRSVFPTQPTFVDLTAREQAILEMIAANHTSTHMAQTLRISANTVKTHRRTLYLKLGAHSRSELLDNADGAGLLQRADGVRGMRPTP